MAACEGLPDRSCPKQNFDPKVRFTIYDLFLCEYCDRVRGEDENKNRKLDKLKVACAVSIDRSKYSGSKGVFCEKNSRKLGQLPTDADAVVLQKLQQKSNIQLKSNTALLDVEINGFDDAIVNEVKSDTEPSSVKEDQVALLRLELHRQHNLISKLQHQLQSVLSLLGIADQDIQPTDADSLEQTNNAETCPGDTIVVFNSNAKPLWAEVAANAPQQLQPPAQKQPRKLVTNFQRSLIAAVYVDQSEKKRRESSLIVSGLPESNSQTDKQLFTKLCCEELNTQPDILTTKRLGRAQPDKSRPLLIVTSKADQAQHLIAVAKQLRKSANMTVRKSVFINPNLTKAEAEAAYSVRVQRRQATIHRADVQPSLITEEVNASKHEPSDLTKPPMSTPSTPHPLVPTNDATALSNNTAPPAAEHPQQQGRPVRC